MSAMKPGELKHYLLHHPVKKDGVVFRKKSKAHYRDLKDKANPVVLNWGKK